MATTRKKLRWLAVGAGVLAGGMAAANAWLRAAAPPEAAALPGEERWFLWRTGRVAYYEGGSGPDVALLHGPNAAASSFEMHRLFEGLRGGCRVLAPDLPGFGRSDRPAVIYSGELYADFVRDFVEAVTSPGAAIIASSLSAAYAIEAVAARPGHFSSLVLINPTMAARAPAGGTLGQIMRLPVVGEAMFNALVSVPSLNYYLRDKVFGHPDRLDSDYLEQNYATSHRGNARFAPASFIGGQLNLERAWADYEQLRLPVLLVWGDRAAYVTAEQRHEWESRNPRARSLTVPDAGETPHLERPEVVLTDLELYLADVGVRR